MGRKGRQSDGGPGLFSRAGGKNILDFTFAAFKGI
jgi:hypothetical protein